MAIYGHALEKVSQNGWHVLVLVFFFQHFLQKENNNIYSLLNLISVGVSPPISH